MKKTGRPVQFEITEQTRTAVANLIRRHYLRLSDYRFPSRLANSPHLSTRQYARIVQGWVASIGLDPATCGTRSLRRTKAALIYRKTGNLRAVQLLLGHTKLESTVRYLGVEADDAIAILRASISKCGRMAGSRRAGNSRRRAPAAYDRRKLPLVQILQDDKSATATVIGGLVCALVCAPFARSRTAPWESSLSRSGH